MIVIKSLVRRKYLAGTFLVIAAIGALNQAYLAPHAVEQALSYIVYPIMIMQRTFVAPIQQWLESREDTTLLQTSIKQLEAEREQLLAQLIELQASQAFDAEIKELTEFKQRYSMTNAIMAQVLIKHISEQAHFFILDAGSHKGVQKNMVAVYKDMLIGKVIEVYPLYSKVLLITDHLCKVSAFCAASKATGIHAGTNNIYQASLTRVSHLDQLNVGDLILSSGDGLIFPRGFALGRVAAYTQNDLFYEVTTQPLLDFHKVPYCYLVQKGAEIISKEQTDDALKDPIVAPEQPSEVAAHN